MGNRVAQPSKEKSENQQDVRQSPSRQKSTETEGVNSTAITSTVSLHRMIRGILLDAAKVMKMSSDQPVDPRFFYKTSTLKADIKDIIDDGYRSNIKVKTTSKDSSLKRSSLKPVFQRINMELDRETRVLAGEERMTGNKKTKLQIPIHKASQRIIQDDITEKRDSKSCEKKPSDAETRTDTEKQHGKSKVSERKSLECEHRIDKGEPAATINKKDEMNQELMVMGKKINLALNVEKKTTKCNDDPDDLLKEIGSDFDSSSTTSKWSGTDGSDVLYEYGSFESLTPSSMMSDKKDLNSLHTDCSQYNMEDKADDEWQEDVMSSASTSASSISNTEHGKDDSGAVDELLKDLDSLNAGTSRPLSINEKETNEESDIADELLKELDSLELDTPMNAPVVIKREGELKQRPTGTNRGIDRPSTRRGPEERPVVQRRLQQHAVVRLLSRQGAEERSLTRRIFPYEETSHEDTEEVKTLGAKQFKTQEHHSQAEKCGIKKIKVQVTYDYKDVMLMQEVVGSGPAVDKKSEDFPISLNEQKELGEVRQEPLPKVLAQDAVHLLHQEPFGTIPNMAQSTTPETSGQTNLKNAEIRGDRFANKKLRKQTIYSQEELNLMQDVCVGQLPVAGSGGETKTLHCVQPLKYDADELKLIAEIEHQYKYH